MPDYYSRVNETLLNFIPLNASNVLEVGCGSGVLAKRYKQRNPKCVWTGIETNTEAGLAATNTGGCDRVHFWDATHAVPMGYYDCLIFGDVLEHMTDPLGCLKRHASHIVEGGQILASIPSIGFYVSIVNLLRQEWPSMDEGLFDRTHLKWFTKTTIEKMFSDAELSVFEMVPCYGNTDLFDTFFKAVERGKFDAAFGVDLAKLKQEASVLQWLVRSVKGEAPRNRLLVRPFPGPACCYRPRLLEPGLFMNTVPGIKYSEAITDITKWESVIVVRQRTNWFRDQIKSMVANGCIIVGEWDDDPKVFASGVEHATEPIDLMVRGCHAVQTTTERMAETLRQWNPKVAVFPNQIMELPPPRVYSDDGPVGIFFGAQNRKTDWLPIMPALNRVLDEYRDRVFVEVVHDKEFYDALKIPVTRKRFQEFLPYDEYRKTLRLCDIALLPLEPTEFNEHKSDIKFIECAAEGVAVWAQHTVYFEPIFSQVSVTSESTDAMGMVSECLIGFEEDLKILIDNPEFRRMLATRSYSYVRDNRLLKDHYAARIEWYQDLVARKAELDEALKARAPELFD